MSQSQLQLPATTQNQGSILAKNIFELSAAGAGKMGTGPVQIPTLIDTLPLDWSSWSTLVDAAASTAARAKRANRAPYELACFQILV
jgi:hypothetical protein